MSIWHNDIALGENLKNKHWNVKSGVLLLEWINTWISFCYTFFLFVCYVFWTGLTVRIIIFSFELYFVRKKQNKSIKPVCLANAAVQFCPTGSLLLCVHAFISALLVFLPYLPSWLFLTSSFLCLIWARWSMPCSMCLGWSYTLVSLSHSWNKGCQKASGCLISGGCVNTSLPEIFLFGLIVHEQCSSHH